MRIGVLNWRDEAHHEAGGAELIVHELTERWLAWGHEVELVTSLGRKLPKTDKARGVPLTRIGKVRNFTHHLGAPRRVRRSGPDVILESVNTIPYLLPLRPGGYPPVVCLVHQLAYDVWNAHFPTPLARAAAAVEPIFYRPYRNVPMVAYSRSTAGDLEHLGIQNVSVIPQGGDGIQTIGKKSEVPTLVFAARLAANKRPDHAIEALQLIRQEVPNARLIMLGDGEMLPELRRHNPAGVEFMGKLPRPEVLKIMGKAHLLVACSIREGWGLVVTEANSVGTPCVTYDVHGLRDSVRDGQTGLLTEANPAAMAKSVIGLLKDPVEYNRLRENAITWGSSQSWDNMASSVLQHLGRAAGIPISTPINSDSVVDLREIDIQSEEKAEQA